MTLEQALKRYNVEKPDQLPPSLLALFEYRARELDRFASNAIKLSRLAKFMEPGRSVMSMPEVEDRREVYNSILRAQEGVLAKLRTINANIEEEIK